MQKARHAACTAAPPAFSTHVPAPQGKVATEPLVIFTTFSSAELLQNEKLLIF